jgi:hypothetical protein
VTFPDAPDLSPFEYLRLYHNESVAHTCHSKSLSLAQLQYLRLAATGY